MKIAFVTDDGKTISRHFGRATHYAVVTVENGQETGREMRPKLGHHHFAGEEHPHEHHDSSQGSGLEPAAQDRHNRMLAAIDDCQVLVGGGMGTGAYRSMQAANIKPYITDYDQINDALQAYLDGSLVDHREKLH